MTPPPRHLATTFWTAEAWKYKAAPDKTAFEPVAENDQTLAHVFLTNHAPVSKSKRPISNQHDQNLSIAFEHPFYHLITKRYVLLIN